MQIVLKTVEVKAQERIQAKAGGAIQAVQDFKMLVKFRLTLTVVFSSLMGFLIAHPGGLDFAALGVLALGGFLVTGAANALNQVLEKDYDKLMQRTANRPVAAGRMRPADAVLIAGIMSLIGITLLALFNPWTAFLGMVALILYAFVYTPLKRVGPIAVVVGAFPGALPTLIGAAAAEGRLSALGLSLFAIQFFWQFPHFWSIGWLGHEDYTKAGYRLLPGGVRDRQTGLQAFLYAIPLLGLGLVPFLTGISGPISAVVIFGLSCLYAYLGWGLYRFDSRKAALQLMFFSFFYIPGALIAIWVDKI